MSETTQITAIVCGSRSGDQEGLIWQWLDEYSKKIRIGLLIQTGMSLAAQREEIYPPHLGLLVGDRPEDRACADNAGLRFMDAAEWRKLDPLSISQPSTPPL